MARPQILMTHMQQLRPLPRLSPTTHCADILVACACAYASPHTQTHDTRQHRRTVDRHVRTSVRRRFTLE